MSARDTIFNYTFDDLLLLPTPTIEKWIYKAELRITASIKQQQHQTNTSNHPIRRFFQRLVQPITTQR
jgi:hypothetical protein